MATSFESSVLSELHDDLFYTREEISLDLTDNDDCDDSQASDDVSDDDADDQGLISGESGHKRSPRRNLSFSLKSITRRGRPKRTGLEHVSDSIRSGSSSWLRRVFQYDSVLNRSGEFFDELSMASDLTNSDEEFVLASIAPEEKASGTPRRQHRRESTEKTMDSDWDNYHPNCSQFEPALEKSIRSYDRSSYALAESYELSGRSCRTSYSQFEPALELSFRSEEGRIARVDKDFLGFSSRTQGDDNNSKRSTRSSRRLGDKMKKTKRRKKGKKPSAAAKKMKSQ